MKFRRIFSILAVAALVTTGAACSSDKEESKPKIEKKDQTQKDTTVSDSAGKDTDDKDLAAESDINSDAGGDTSASTTPGDSDPGDSDEDFSSAIKDVNAKIDAAGSDKCALAEAFNSSPPEPADSAQMKQFINTYAKMMNAVADSMGGDSNHSQVIKRSTKALEKLAADKNYAPELKDDEDLSKIVDADDYNAAMEEFDKMTADCPQSDG